MTRRTFAWGLGVVALWAAAIAHGQQQTIPIIGFLSSGSPRAFAKFLRSFQEGLREQGFVEGQNITFRYRWAEGHFDELDAMAAELVEGRVDLIAATGGMRSAEAAKRATNTVPIVFVVGFDPVALGLVTSFNKPGGNITGTTIITTELATKRLSLLLDLEPAIQKVAILVNPASTSVDVEIQNVLDAAKNAGRSLVVLKASSGSEIDAAFSSAVEQQVRGIVISADPFFMGQRAQLVSLATSRKIPVVYPFREFVDEGGLMSYGPSLALAYHRAGVYAGSILKGAKPSELPVESPTSFEFLINLKTVKTFGLNVPSGLLAIVDATVE